MKKLAGTLLGALMGGLFGLSWFSVFYFQDGKLHWQFFALILLTIACAAYVILPKWNFFQKHTV